MGDFIFRLVMRFITKKMSRFRLERTTFSRHPGFQALNSHHLVSLPHSDSCIRHKRKSGNLTSPEYHLAFFYPKKFKRGFAKESATFPDFVDNISDKSFPILSLFF
jgi:hypothetical protein